MPKEKCNFNEKEFKGLFEFSTDSKKLLWAKCLIKSDDKICGVQIKTEIGGYFKKYNLWRHLKRHHTTVYEQLIKGKKEEEEAECAKIVKAPYKCEQQTIKSYFKASKLSVNMDVEKFKAGIIEMVSLNSAPLTLFSSCGFQKIAGEMAQLLGVALGHEAIRNLVISRAAEARINLIEEMKGKLLFLKMDAATRGQKKFLAINVQFFNEIENKICIRTLEIVDTEHNHGSEYIKNKVKQVLLKFEIDVKQILSICVDNAANMTRAVKDISDIDYEAYDLILVYEEYDLTNSWVEQPELIIPSWLHLTDDAIQVMRCVVHTLQLAVWSGLNTELAKRKLTEIRNAVVKLRTPTIRSLLLKKFGLCQFLDTVTRWGSTFLMIQRLEKFRGYCEEAVAAGAVELDLDWDAVRNLCNVLEKPYQTTILLQSATITPGFCFKEWCRLKSFLNKEPGIIAMSILIAMKKRECNIFTNTHFLAAVYVDPRYRILLNDDQIDLAKSGLWHIAVRLNKILNLDTVSDNSKTETNTSTSTASEDDDFEKELDRIEKRKSLSKLTASNSDDFKVKFEESLQIIEKFGRCKTDDVFKIFSMYPKNIQLICSIASSLPTSQVSVERLFSALKLIVTDLRQCIKEDLLSAILFLRQNHEIVN